MSVLETVLIVEPDNSPTLPVVGSPVQYNPYVHAGSLRPWSVFGQAAGDASGGSVGVRWYMRPHGDGAKFATITEIKVKMSDTNGQYTYIDSSDWEYSPYEKKAMDVAAEWIPNRLVEIDRPLSLGSIAAGTPGTLTVYFSANTNTKAYIVEARGWFSDRPFLTPLTVTP